MARHALWDSMFFLFTTVLKAICRCVQLRCIRPVASWSVFALAFHAPLQPLHSSACAPWGVVEEEKKFSVSFHSNTAL